MTGLRFMWAASIRVRRYRRRAFSEEVAAREAMVWLLDKIPNAWVTLTTSPPFAVNSDILLSLLSFWLTGHLIALTMVAHSRHPNSIPPVVMIVVLRIIISPPIKSMCEFSLGSRLNPYLHFFTAAFTRWTTYARRD